MRSSGDSIFAPAIRTDQAEVSIAMRMAQSAKVMDELCVSSATRIPVG